jgi:ubiquinone/menaquinone biosynthesis C-methylase UbiE
MLHEGDGIERDQRWEGQVQNWTTHARSTESDPFFWRVNLPHVMQLLPPSPCQVLDIGAGEGRLGRAISERGHRVVSVDRSLGMLGALSATQAGGALAVGGDACALPIRSESVDCLVSMMLLMSVADAAAAMRETTRVLRRGGLAIVAILHPLITSGSMGSDGRLRVGGYARSSRRAPRQVQRQVPLVYHHYHRPVATYLNWSIQAGLEIESVLEPVPHPADVAVNSRFERWTEIPNMLLWAARRREVD